MDTDRPVGRCINCWHDFATGPCGGCGAVPKPCPSCAGTGDGVGVSASTGERMLTDCAACDGSGYAEPLALR
jgi:hypothetical protein